MRTIEELEGAGVSAVTIEDSVPAGSFGFAETTGLVSIAEGVGKMRAAVAARRNSSTVIIARIASFSVSGLEDTIQRAKAYEQTGVDALRLPGSGLLPTRRAGGGDRKAHFARLAWPKLRDRDYLAAEGFASRTTAISLSLRPSAPSMRPCWRSRAAPIHNRLYRRKRRNCSNG